MLITNWLLFQHTTKLEKFIPEFETNKQKIQNAFWETKRIRVDQVRRDGSGNSSDGNVSCNHDFKNVNVNDHCDAKIGCSINI